MKKFSWKGPMETVRPSWLTAPGLSKSTSLRAVPKCLLNTDSPRAAPTLLGSLCQCLITLMVKNFFLMLSPGLPWIPGRREQRPASPSVPPFRELRGAARSPLGLLFSRPDEPRILNLSSQNMSSTSTIFVAFLWVLPTSSFDCGAQTCTQYPTWGHTNTKHSTQQCKGSCFGMLLHGQHCTSDFCKRHLWNL